MGEGQPACPLEHPGLRSRVLHRLHPARRRLLVHRRADRPTGPRDRRGGFFLCAGCRHRRGDRALLHAARHETALGEAPRGPAGAVIVGIAFALGWTPCVGPVLGSILTLAASGGGIRRPAPLFLFVYSLGLGIPFLIAGLFVGKALRAFSRVRRRCAPSRSSAESSSSSMEHFSSVASSAGWGTACRAGSSGRPCPAGARVARAHGCSRRGRVAGRRGVGAGSHPVYTPSLAPSARGGGIARSCPAVCVVFIPPLLRQQGRGRIDRRR